MKGMEYLIHADTCTPFNKMNIPGFLNDLLLQYINACSTGFNKFNQNNSWLGYWYTR